MKKVFRLENLFVVMILSLGTLFAILTPPNQVPDESSHFAQVYEILDGKFTQLYVKMPESLIAMLEKYRAAYSAPKPKLMFDLYLNDFKTGEKNSNPGTIQAASYSPVLYFPQISGLGLGKLLKVGEIEKFMLGRLFSILIYAMAGYFILKKATFAQSSLFALLVMPMSVCLAASYSADTMQTLLSFLYISLLAAELPSQGYLSIQKKITLILLGVLLGLTKPVSLVLILLAFAIPLNRFKNKMSKLVFMLVHLGFSVLPAFIWTKSISSNLILQDAESRGVSPAGQLIFILQNPFLYIKTVLESIFLNREFLLKTFMGKFGWSTIELPWFVYLLFTLLLCLALFRDTDNPFVLTKTQKIIFLTVFLMYILGTVTSMYLFATTVGTLQVNGVQGRYFIPDLPVLLYFILSWLRLKKFPWPWVTTGAISVLATLILLFSIRTIFLGFFAPCGEKSYLNYRACQLPDSLQADRTVGELDGAFTQTFTSECDDLTGVGIFFVPGSGQKTGNLDISLFNLTTNQLVAREKLFVEERKGNAWKRALTFPPIPASKNAQFVLKIAVINGPLNAASLGATATDIYPQGKLSGVDFPTDLVFRYACKPGIAEQLLSGRK